MSRQVALNETDRSIRFWAYDSDGAAVTGETYNSAGMAVSVIVRAKGRIVSTTALTLIARDVAGTHQDSAFTEVGSGEYLIDLPDSYLATADRVISLSVASDAITGTVIVETLEIGLLSFVSNAVIASGTGARTVTITVDDGTDPLQNALIRMTEGANTYTTLTNTSGVATFNLDDATYIVSITKSGYSYAGTTLVVDGTEVETYSMSAISISPGSGSFTTGFVVAYDGDGAIEEGAIVYSELTKVPTSDTGFSYDSIVKSNVSDANGLVQITGLAKGGTYRIWRGQRKATATDNLYVIPSDAGTTYELPSHIGREQ